MLRTSSRAVPFTEQEIVMAAPAAAPPWLDDADLAAQKYTEAVAEAVEKCAGDTKGQTCYICTEALHWKTKEGLVRGCSCRGTSGVAHVSCLVEQAKILVAEAEENNLGNKVLNERFERWCECSLCEQKYHGAVRCALGWACWKTYVGRPEVDRTRASAMTQLGNGLSAAGHDEDAVSVYEAELSMQRRLGDSEDNIFAVQGNLACVYAMLERLEEAMCLRKDVYYGWLKLKGGEHGMTLIAALNYANSLCGLERFEEAKSLLRKTIPVAQGVLGKIHGNTLRMRFIYALALCEDANATLDDLREAVTTLENTERTARRVLGGAHPPAAALRGPCKTREPRSPPARRRLHRRRRRACN